LDRDDGVIFTAIFPDDEVTITRQNYTLSYISWSHFLADDDNVINRLKREKSPKGDFRNVFAS
jgi:hypothetical protein